MIDFDRLLDTVPDEGAWHATRTAIDLEIVRRDRLFAAMLEERPNDTQLWIARGRYLSWLERWDDALTAYDKLPSPTELCTPMRSPRSTPVSSSSGETMKAIAAGASVWPES